jgi:hypothetical protein
MIKKIILSFFLSVCLFQQAIFAYELNEKDQEIISNFMLKFDKKINTLNSGKKLQVKDKFIVSFEGLKEKYKNNERVFTILNDILINLQNTIITKGGNILHKAILSNLTVVLDKNTFLNNISKVVEDINSLKEFKNSIYFRDDKNIYSNIFNSGGGIQVDKIS